jgi:competence protein ComEA
VDSVTEAWRVLEDPGENAARTTPPAPPPPAGDAAGRPLWPFIAVGIGMAVAAAIWLMATGTSGSAVSVNAVVQARASGARSSAGADTSNAPSAEPSRSAAIAIVEVNGAVKRPGVYRLSEGSRIAEAIAAAGGYSASVDSAAAQALNLAAKIVDGQQVHVPKRGEGAGPTQPGQQANAGGGTGGADVTGPVNINTATSAQLEALPGIGPATAAKIIAARAEARFATVDELRGRKIVGAATFEKIRGLVVVR